MSPNTVRAISFVRDGFDCINSAEDGDEDKDEDDDEEDEDQVEKVEVGEDGFAVLPQWGGRSLEDYKQLIRQYVTTNYREYFIYLNLLS